MREISKTCRVWFRLGCVGIFWCSMSKTLGQFEFRLFKIAKNWSNTGE